MKTSIKEEEEL